MRTVAFHTLGCKLNFSETSAIGRQFLEHGFVKREFTEPADVYVVNTCSVTDQANKKCRHVIRQALRQNPAGYVIVVGCYAQLKPQEIAEIPGVDLVLGAGEKFRVFELAGDFTKEDHACVHHAPIGAVNTFTAAWSAGDRTRSFLKIQDGCDYKCTFCTIPLARGRSRSDSLSNVLQNAREIAARGIQEIVLTGVNLGDYGHQPHTFLDVVRALDALPDGPARYRISSIEPNLLTDEIIRLVAAAERFMPHFHIPLQSGSDEILARMRRRYRRALYTDRVQTIRDLMPQACIGVDVITGFPGETEAHFEETYQYLTDLDVSYLHVFTYSERENTLAAGMPDPVPHPVRQARTERLRMLSEKKRLDFYRRAEGQTWPVLLEGDEDAGYMSGFTPHYVRVQVPWNPAWVNTLQPVRLGPVTPAGVVTGEPVLIYR
ncbi:MAG: tRNA (N(6)-L-threonylcarbamoyladenosine(37)-C(2))-methylthiotransferase MtaB [Bacteroidia bacterium]|nr:tRNA (N(6)-L-threonylcarbamoyladenosine(37)-C(2))-methylthiotransferase MtaB [Bacteroidia bacterium]